MRDVKLDFGVTGGGGLSAGNYEERERRKITEKLHCYLPSNGKGKQAKKNVKTNNN